MADAMLQFCTCCKFLATAIYDLGGIQEVPLAASGVIAPVSLRDRKKLVTRRTLRQAALRLVAERGFDRVTVEDIAEAAGVSTRTFFNYFPTKEAVVFGIDPSRVESLRARLLERPAKEPPFVAVRHAFVEESRTIADELSALGGDPAEWIALLREAHGDAHLRAAHAAHMASVERLVAETVALRIGSDVERDPYPTLLASAAVGTMRGVFALWACAGRQFDLESLTDAAFETLANGFPERCAIRRLVGVESGPRSRTSSMFRRTRR